MSAAAPGSLPRSTQTTAAGAATPIVRAARTGARRGVTEFGHMLTSREDIVPTVFFGLLPLAVLVFFERQGNLLEVGSLSVPYLQFVTPGMFAVIVAFSMISPMYYLAAEREDGTLLRMRSMPNGLVGYTVGRMVSVSLEAVFGLLLVLVPALFLFSGLSGVPALGWLHFVAIFVLGVLAILPLGMLVGSFLRNAKGIFSIGLAAVGALTIVSGLYQPIQAFPAWLQVIGQVFPVYWIGHGMRHALLPDIVAAAEFGGTWRPVLTIVVLGAWAAVGMVAAPLALRRTARRESGSQVEARRNAKMAQAY